ncbi:hypothetical protein pb186bvf_013394 [Paramecium bursaria]
MGLLRTYMRKQFCCDIQQLQMNQNDQIALNINKQKRDCPWREPVIHKENKPLNEILFSQCYDQTYDLTQMEIRQWWELRAELFPLYDANDLNCVKRVKGLWYLLTETECQQIKNPKWTEFGFQQQDPTTDLEVVEFNRWMILLDLYKKIDKLYPRCAIPHMILLCCLVDKYNISFEEIFPFIRQLRPQGQNQEVANRVGLKGFCHLLVKEEYFWQRLHKMLLVDLFTIWVNQRKTNPKTTILDFGIAQNTLKARVSRTFSARLFGCFEDLENYYKSL